MIDSRAVTEATLVETFSAIGMDRMRDLPFYNERLAVEAVSFRQWDGHRIGVLITPWLMNLMLLPGEGEDWSGFAEGEVREWRLPSGRYRFVAGVLDGVGVYFSAVLFTSVEAFPDQETARAVASETMVQIFADQRGRDSLGDDDMPAGKEVLRQRVSRRGLLRRLAMKDD